MLFQNQADVKKLKGKLYQMKQQFSKMSQYKEVLKMQPGMQFGELALLKDEPRAATVIARKDTHFLTIAKEDYSALLKKIEFR